jgi:hypothetical protein
MAHIFSCPHEAAMESRKTALSAYKSSLIAKQTSVDLVEEIVRGITERITLGTHAPSPNPETSHAAVVQQQELGWVSFLQGYVGTEWRQWFQTVTRTKAADQSNTWVRNLILANWTYSKAIWDSRNALVHGKTDKVIDSKVISQLKKRIKELYMMFKRDWFCVPYSSVHLFDHPILMMQQLPKENMRCTQSL